MAYKVCKFGGTSLATREQIYTSIGIMLSDSYRKFMVVSAPGKRDNNDTKITDILIRAAENQLNGIEDMSPVGSIKKRIYEIGHDVGGVADQLCRELDARLSDTNAPNYMDYIKAFGEYASARLIAAIMQKNRAGEAKFLDPKDIGFIATSESGNARPDETCYPTIAKNLLPKHPRGTERPIAVIPGFYAYTKRGDIITLPRGGSDTTGAVIANAVGAVVYENWTDTDGLQRADPRIVRDPEIIREITYRESRELAYLNFKLQEEAMIPVMQKQIPIHVLNTNNPSAKGTLVVYDRVVPSAEYIIGVACKAGYIPISIFKQFMNREIGFGGGIFRIFREMGIPYEHSPTGIDEMTVIVEKESVSEPGKVNNLIRKLNEELGPLEAKVGDSTAMVVVAGLGMKRHVDTEAKVLSALAGKGIKPLMMNEGASEISFFIGVREEQADDAVRAIYNEFNRRKNN